LPSNIQDYRFNVGDVLNVGIASVAVACHVESDVSNGSTRNQGGNEELSQRRQLDQTLAQLKSSAMRRSLPVEAPCRAAAQKEAAAVVDRLNSTSDPEFFGRLESWGTSPPLMVSIG